MKDTHTRKVHNIILMSDMTLAFSPKIFRLMRRSQAMKITSWWFQLISKILVKLDHFPKYLDENKKCLSCHHLDQKQTTPTTFPTILSNPPLLVQSFSKGFRVLLCIEGTQILDKTDTFFFRGKLQDFPEKCRKEKCADSLRATFRVSFPWGTLSHIRLMSKWDWKHS